MTRLLVRCASVAVALALLVVGPGRADARDDDDRGVEAKNMKLVGINDLQARSAYQPIVHQQGGRSIAYIGHHGGEALNTLNNTVEKNGTSIVDVTNPRRPKFLFHIPGPSGVGEAGGAQMVRACSAKELPNANLNSDLARNKHYLLRATASSHEVYDVTNPSNPTLVKVVVGNLPNTHKSWWECDTGIAYLVTDGRDLEHASPACGGGPVTSGCNWRTNRMTQIFDLSNPATPVFIRNYGLVGQQPGSSGAVPTGVHGMIAIGNTIYFGHGTGSNGIMQIVDRTKLLGACRSPAACATTPSATDLLSPQLGRLDTSPTMGAHTTFPVLQQPVPDFKHSPNNVRDFVVLVNEAGGNKCSDNRQLVYIVDVSTPSKPMPVSSFHVPESSGNFCSRGGRFGSHSSNESFTSLFYGKLVFVSWFNAGVRAIDIREPFSPREAGFFIPRTTDKTDTRPEGCKLGVDNPCDVVIQTNNVEVDERGLIYIVDRANTGMHILRLTGEAAKIAGLPGGDDD
jgi:hypothetical protein